MMRLVSSGAFFGVHCMYRSEVYETVLLSILAYSEEKCANTAWL